MFEARLCVLRRRIDQAAFVIPAKAGIQQWIVDCRLASGLAAFGRSEASTSRRQTPE
jgi:hypothetical protein